MAVVGKSSLLPFTLPCHVTTRDSALFPLGSTMKKRQENPGSGSGREVQMGIQVSAISISPTVSVMGERSMEGQGPSALMLTGMPRSRTISMVFWQATISYQVTPVSEPCGVSLGSDEASLPFVRSKQ